MCRPRITTSIAASSTDGSRALTRSDYTLRVLILSAFHKFTGFAEAIEQVKIMVALIMVNGVNLVLMCFFSDCVELLSHYAQADFPNPSQEPVNLSSQFVFA